MAGDPGQNHELSPIQRLHEALVEHKRVFLSNAVARVYRRATELPPMPVGQEHPAEGWSEYWVPFTDTLDEWNERIRQSQVEAEEWRKEGKTPLPRVVELTKRPPWTAESFAAHLISAFGQDGNPLDLAKVCFESLHEEDLGRETVTAHWLIMSRADAEELEQSAARGDRALREVAAWLHGADCLLPPVELEAMVRGSLRYRGNRWRPREVPWRYLDDLGRGIEGIRKLTRLAFRAERPARTDAAPRPDDLLTLRVAVQKFQVSPTTLQRAIQSCRLRSYRLPGGTPNRRHLVSESELSRLYEPKP